MSKNLQDLFDDQAKNHHHSHYIQPREMTDEHRANISKALTGRVLSDEHCAAIAKGNKGRRHSEEHKHLIRTGNLGKVHTEETKAKQSAGAKKRWKENPYIAPPEVLKKRGESIKKAWAERRAAMPPKEAEPAKERGRPKTRTLPDPTLPKRGRGRPPKVSSH